MSKLTKLIRDPNLFFYDYFAKRMLQNMNSNGNSKNPQIYAFHISDWKRNLFVDFFGKGKFVKFVPFKNIPKKLIDEIKLHPERDLFIWGMNLPEELNSCHNKKYFIEDGFIRSVGLGAEHTLPFSLTVDTKSLYLDSRVETDLELMIKNFNPEKEKNIVLRARQNIEEIIKLGISKYNNCKPIDISTIYGQKTKKRILVIGQVEDDASIIYGSKKKFNNNDLVFTARLENPDAEIYYKPHPDVLAGKRKELSNPNEVKNICKIIT